MSCVQGGGKRNKVGLGELKSMLYGNQRNGGSWVLKRNIHSRVLSLQQRHFSGCVALLDSQGETWQHAQPPKIPPLTIRNIHANNQIRRYTPASADTSTLRYPPDKQTDSQGETWQHAQPPKIPPSTIRNIHANNQIRHHTCFGSYAVYDNAKRAAPAALLALPYTSTS
ncbi:hypothetical protein BS47DRAFT_1386562, partial [Hydnum rufescens UP504]